MQTSFDNLVQDADPTIVKKFISYHQKNPQVYDLFKKYSLEAKASGRNRFSVWLIANRIRWYTNVETTGKEFKITNDYLAFYARLLISENNNLSGLFTLKKLKAKRTKAVE